MRIALVQCSAGADGLENLRRGLESLEGAAREGAELVCFPELAFTRFLPQEPATGDVRSLAEPVPGPTTEAFARKARELGVVVIINLFERAGDRCYDTSPVIDADGRLLGRTRMVHVIDTDRFHERGYYAPGDTGAPVYDTRAGRIGVAICYDRHYPEYMRALALGGADLVVIPQAGAVDEWPDGLFEAEVRTSAFQNGYFAALCNRVGKEERLAFAGKSFVCGQDGSMIARAGEGDEILFADVDLSAADRSHARRLFLRDRRPELYPGFVAPGGLRKLTDYLVGLGLEKIGHTKKNYLAHLVAVYKGLQRWGCGGDVCRGGMFHSIYGTEMFQGFTLSLDRRGEVRGLIGHRAERLGWANCAMDRPSFDRAVGQKQGPYRFRNRLDDGTIEMDEQDFRDLCLIHLSDWLEQVPRSGKWDLRREAYRRLASRLGGVPEEEWSRVYSEAPS